MNKRGSVPLLVAGLVPTFMLAGVVAVNATNFWLQKARLQAALDAGALLAARDIQGTKRDANVKALVTAIYNENAPSGSRLNKDDVKVSVIDGDKVQVTASVGVSSLVGTTGTESAGSKRTLERGATANITSTGMELALVFDITLSMVNDDSTNGEKRITSAVKGALAMLTTLYGDNPAKPALNKKWGENLFISVVPFNVTANYGKANTHFLADPPTDPDPEYPVSWSGATEWGGCVEMRPISLLDANPKEINGGLRRYYWPSTYNASLKYIPSSSQSQCRSEAAYVVSRATDTLGANRVCMGHNDWTAPAYVLTGTEGKQNRLIISFAGNSLVKDAKLDAWATAHGPNMMCPRDTQNLQDTQAVLPLTRDRAVVEQRINAMAKLPFSYGTNIAAGLQAGWFTLSPRWRAGSGFNGWPSAEPQPVTNDTRPELPKLPLDYNTARMRKVMILLTDGDNLWLSARDVQGNVNSLVRPESHQTQGFYGSYGYLGPDYTNDTRLTASSTSDGSSKIDDAAEDWCAKIKASTTPKGPEKITIMTIGFGSSIGSRATAVLRNCASTEDGKKLYYPAPTSEALMKVFEAIGSDLTKLRLSE